MRNLRKNKKGVMQIVMFFAILFIILIGGFFFAMLTGIIDIASDEITPLFTGIGTVGDANVSQYSEFTFGNLNKIVQFAPILLALIYVLALVMSVVFIIAYSYNPHPIFIGLYFGFIIFLVFGAIIMSNMYQDIYTGNDDLATRLQGQTIMSFMILHSPVIMTIIAFITGIFLFANPRGQGDVGV